MQKKELYFGNSKIKSQVKDISGEFVSLDGEEFYKITHYDRMTPFFMSIVSSSDHWMFVSSNGGLTCGRKNPESALFPYYTDDKIHDASHTSGSRVIIVVNKENKSYVWEPFMNTENVYPIQRNIYKSIVGNKLIFEEVNLDLEVVFTYHWMNSDKFGFVRQSTIKNFGDKKIEVEFIDGLRNILPYGVNRGLQNTMSTLVDGYKQSEIITDAGLGIYTLSSILTDRAEPSEALKANIVWYQGIQSPKYLLSEDQVNFFKSGREIKTETFKKGVRGSFFVNSQFELPAGSSNRWYIISDVNKGPSDVVELVDSIKTGSLIDSIMEDVHSGTVKLKQLVSLADGQQISADKPTTSRHFSNVLFNIMRGGIFSDDYLILKDDFVPFIEKRNRPVYMKHRDFLLGLKDKEILFNLAKAVREKEDADLERLTLEYLPLIFSRRHGDPSRPWNVFSIDIKKEDGSENRYYQGNWRDIFQNWEALSWSFPEYLESFIAKFLNASTADGYNPYRVMKDGIDWEILDPEDPWSNIGYWGDHQIIYLVRLLELSMKFHSERLTELLGNNILVYVNVPYKIKGYDALISDPRNTIEYDTQLADKIEAQVSHIGADGKLHLNKKGEPLKVNMLEKLLVPVLAKLSNFVPGGGIWMNTQRPEWNDANNALVGYGLSMVTVYYLRRYLQFLKQLIKKTQIKTVLVSSEVYENLNSVFSVLESGKEMFESDILPQKRKWLLDKLGAAGEEYRDRVYKGFNGEKSGVDLSSLVEFIDLAIAFVDHTIHLNKREDGLYHSYNLIHFESDGYTVENLYEMLEGQVAVLSSGILNPVESLDVLKALRNSKIYRENQNSYMLYPDRKLPSFLEKNIIPEDLLNQISWLLEKQESGTGRIIEKDIHGKIHFNGAFKNSTDLRLALEKDSTIAYEEIDEVCAVYEKTFNHRQFTGRSGTFYKYEGLGCIYWHMVSKLLLAVQEVYQNAYLAGEHKEILEELAGRCYEIKEGIGVHKSPREYGAFPIDPYSHTPSFAGVQQPGMTGQVKEDIISRFSELGVQLIDGEINFRPTLLKVSEFTETKTTWRFITRDGYRDIELPARSLGFSLCGMPVIYTRAEKIGIQVELSDGRYQYSQSVRLSKELSQSIFKRESKVVMLTVAVDIP